MSVVHIFFFPFACPFLKGWHNILFRGGSSLIILVVQLCFPIGAMCQGFSTLTPITTSSIARNTGEKPQSKVWQHGGKWWAVFAKWDGTYIARLDGTEWTYNLRISSSTSLEADCKVIGDVCHIFLWRRPDHPSLLVSVEYDQVSGSYVPWSLRQSAASIPLDSGAETGTIDIDTRGRMWLAADAVDDIRVWWSDPPYDSWNGPVVIASGVTDDDICVVAALRPQAKIGVLWSNQNSKRFGFRAHVDGNSPEEWSDDEVPSSSSALDVGNGMADDHLNLAVASDGTLYASVKTSYDTEGYPRLGLLKRHPDSTWDHLYEVSQSGTRPIVVLNEAAQKLKVVYTSQEDGGLIVYRESSTLNISFSEPLTLMEGRYNNSTSIKDNYEREVLILASDEVNLVGVLAYDGPSITVGVQPSSRPASTSVRCYPNPVRDDLTVELTDHVFGDMTISITDALGNIRLITNPAYEGTKIAIDISSLDLKPGVYFIILNAGTTSEVIRIITQ